MDFKQHCKQKLISLKKDGCYRIFHAFERQIAKPTIATDPTCNNQEDITIWCSNDYLNMAHNTKVVARASEVLEHTGIGAGGTRNISGTSPHHQILECTLSDWHSKSAALLFTSGYVANFTTLSTLSRQIDGLIIFSDSMNHNSMIEGIRANKFSNKRIFRHNDVAHLDQLMSQEDPERPKLVAWESLYSMDGDFAPNRELLEVCQRYDALSYVDEVHAVGLYGPEGSGVCARDKVQDQVDIIEGTLGKAVGCFGGYIAGDTEIIDFIRSLGTGFIFTTALPPMIAAAAAKSIALLRTADAKRAEQQANAELLRTELKNYCIPFIVSPSHIVPVFVGDAKKCKAASDLLLEQDRIYVQPINYPTVAVGTERLRLTPSPYHNHKKITELCGALDRVWQALDLPRRIPN